MAKTNDNKPNGYALSRAWFDFALTNPDKVSGNHTALYLWIVEINNRIGWQEKFGLTVREAMDGMSCKSRTTYFKCFQNLVEWGFIKIIVSAKNQYQCNIIAIPNYVQAQDDHVYKHRTSTDTDTSKSTSTHTETDTSTILKQETINNKPLNQETIKPDHSLLIKKVMDYFDFNEIANMDKMRDIRSFLICLDANNKTPFFEDQFDGYTQLKSKTDPFKHSFKKFIGDPTNLYEDGAWNAENWKAKLTAEKSKQHGKANQSTNGRRSHLNPPANSYTKL